MTVVCGASTDPSAIDKPPQSLAALRKMHVYVSLIDTSMWDDYLGYLHCTHVGSDPDQVPSA